VMSRLDNWTASGGGMMGGHRVEKTNDTKRTAAEIKSEMESLHQIIMDEKASTKDREAANLKIDRLFIELASTDEYKAEIKRAHEEKIRINEPLNQAALKSMLLKYASSGNDPAVLGRKRQYAALTLIGMDRDQILGKHQNDFNQFLLGDLTLEELRAIRASLPAFRRDQKKQHEFIDSLELKIEQLAKNPEHIVKPKKVFLVKPGLTKTRHMSIGGCGGMANLAAELMSKRRAVEV